MYFKGQIAQNASGQQAYEDSGFVPNPCAICAFSAKAKRKRSPVFPACLYAFAAEGAIPWMRTIPVAWLKTKRAFVAARAFSAAAAQIRIPVNPQSRDLRRSQLRSQTEEQGLRTEMRAPDPGASYRFKGKKDEGHKQDSSQESIFGARREVKRDKRDLAGHGKKRSGGI